MATPASIQASKALASYYLLPSELNPGGRLLQRNRVRNSNTTSEEGGCAQAGDGDGG